MHNFLQERKVPLLAFTSTLFILLYILPRFIDSSEMSTDKRSDWETDRKQNREDTRKRERMWQTVGKSDTILYYFHRYLRK